MTPTREPIHQRAMDALARPYRLELQRMRDLHGRNEETWPEWARAHARLCWQALGELQPVEAV